MPDLTYTVSMPFKIKGKEALKESEFVLALSIDLNLFDPEQARNVLNDAEKAGLVKRENGLVLPLFGLGGGSELKPDSEKGAVFDRIVDRIILGTGIEKRKVVALINKKQEELMKLVVIEVSAILVAIELNVVVDDLIDEEYRALIKHQPYS